MARKPLSEKTVAENCLKWGTGGINIDESRVEAYEMGGNGSELGRFPANLIHDGSDEVRECFPESTSGARKAGFTNKETGYEASSYEIRVKWDKDAPAEKGNASRFFKSIIYTAKASKSERNKGLDDFPDKEIYPQNNSIERKELNSTANTKTKNNHPTVKPIALMEYSRLCRRYATSINV